MCLVGHWIKVCVEFYCPARFLSLRETTEHYSFMTENNKTLMHFIGGTNNTNYDDTLHSLSFFYSYFLKSAQPTLRFVSYLQADIQTD